VGGTRDGARQCSAERKGQGGRYVTYREGCSPSLRVWKRGDRMKGGRKVIFWGQNGEKDKIQSGCVNRESRKMEIGIPLRKKSKTQQKSGSAV